MSNGPRTPGCWGGPLKGIVAGWSLALAAVTVSSPVNAQIPPAPQQAEPDPSQDPPEETGENQDELARRIFALGSRAYEEENFPEAANYFERAFDLSGRAELMYNIGIARERNGQREEALGWFERYLRELPSGVRVDEVRVRVDVLRRALAEAQQPDEPEREAPAPALVAAEAGSGGGFSPVPGWAMVGAGGALAVGGTVLLILAGSASGNVEDAAQGTPWVDVEGDYDQAGLFSALGATGLGLGGALVAGGLVWVVMAGDGESGDMGPDLAVGPTGVTLKGRF